MCGIWGIINSHARAFDYSTFCTLGIANDSRGGDSCGIFIDGYYEYGAKSDDKLFQCHFLGSDYLTKLKNSTIAFGHCRKASVGTIDETTAQPVVLINETGKVEYVLMHNGTIKNYKELAAKYIPDVDITGMTDSQVMARIFYYTGYKALSEYIGGAVFAVADYRGKKPKVLLFKGSSKKDKYSKEATEERPLYYCVDPRKGELIFSSISSYMFAMRPNLTIWILNSNTIFEFNGKDLEAIEEVSRENATQKEDVVSTIYSRNNYCKDFGIWDEGDFLYDNFITTNQADNVYYGKGKKLHGRIYLSKYGVLLDKIYKKSICKEIYFWKGIALKSAACFRFLIILKKESKLKDKEFDEKFNNLIRFLSIDGVYHEGESWFKAISPTKRTLFTGTLNMLTSTSGSEFFSGNRGATYYGRTSEDAFSEIENAKLEINFKTIKEECKFLMK
jgi:hypothetical protein